MDYGDIIGVLIALLAIVISFVSLNRTRKFSERQIALQEETARLSALQRRILEREEEDRNKSDVDAYIYKAERGYRIGIRNTGNVEIRNVRIFVNATEGRTSPLVQSEVSEKLPVDKMRPGDEINLIAALTLETGTTFEAHIKWDTVEGETYSSERMLSI